EEWNFAPTEFNVGVVWDDINYPTPDQVLNRGVNINISQNQTSADRYLVIRKPKDPSDLFTNLGSSGMQGVLQYARPFSGHGGGFTIAFCDGHTKFVNDTIAYDVYMRLMTSNGKKYLQAGTNKALPAI